MNNTNNKRRSVTDTLEKIGFIKNSDTIFSGLNVTKDENKGLIIGKGPIMKGKTPPTKLSDLTKG